MANCQPYLQREIDLIQPKVFVALGHIAFDAILRIFSLSKTGYTFSHASIHALPGEKYLVGSYHPSRQNTNTGRLTIPMFDEVWKSARELLDR